MMATRTVAQRLGRLLEVVTRQSGRLPETPAYGSWLLGRLSESQARRRGRIQIIITVFLLATNLIGIGVATLLLTIAFPSPSIYSDAPLWITFVVTPAYIAVALALGTYLITRRLITALRWAIEGPNQRLRSPWGLCSRKGSDPAPAPGPWPRRP